LFILSRVVGSAAKLYLVALILQTLVFDSWGIPFYLTVTGIIFFIWLYTHKSGIKTIVWTDTLQTICFTVALMLIIWQVSSLLHYDFGQVVKAVSSNPHSRIFYFGDWQSPLNFFKQFLSGIFIVIVMTGLDQDVMQKNLTCRNLKDARKNMLTYGFLFIPVNLLFLSLGVLLLVFANQQGIELPGILDERVPYLVSNYLGVPCMALFIVGLTGASFTNADSAIASLTTSYCIDILNIERKGEKIAARVRKQVHIAMCVVFILVILIINYIGQGNILNTIYKVASYTYGPLLGLYALGLFSTVRVKDRYVPVACILAPVLCYVIEWVLAERFGYKVGYEILLLNGLLTVAGLLALREKKRI
jgi:Na+/proline symporter